MKKTTEHKGFRFFRSNIVMMIVSALLLVAACISVLCFARSYSGLGTSVQNERMDSVSQLGTIILEKIQILAESYVAELSHTRALLMASDADTVDDAARLLGESDNTLCLIFEDGSCMDLKGDTLYFYDAQSIFGSITAGGTKSQFGSVHTRGDYWIFTTPISNVTFDGKNVVGIAKLIDAQQYANITTNNIFDNQGATYVTDTSGVVMFRPDNSGIAADGDGSIDADGDIAATALFKGYNILSDLEAQGASAEQLSTLKDALAKNERSQAIITLDGATWLIQTVPDLSGYNIILTVPISITARDTFTYMRTSVLYILLIVILLATLFILWTLFFIYRSQQLKLERSKAASKSDFMSKISHDIRTPLNAITGMIDIAQHSINDPQMVSECLDNASKSTEYLVSVINDVLDMSRIENGKLVISKRPFNLQNLLRNIMQIERAPAADKNIRLVLEDSTPIEYLYIGDDVRIQQCLINLLSNAIKFTPEGGSVGSATGVGKVTLRSEATTKATGRNALESVQMLRFTVEDNGIGMTKEFMEHMFDPFEQESASPFVSGTVGSGLGLSIVYQLITLMGGTVSVTSQKDEGSVFTLELPLETIVPTYEPQEIQLAESADLTGSRVLLAEDNEINRTIAVYMLNDMGIEVDCADNGSIALERFCSSEAGYYTLILMDIMMPVMDGLEATRRIRASEHQDAATIPIIALSANAFNEDAQKSAAAGMQAHLSKPIDREKLKETLSKYITIKSSN